MEAIMTTKLTLSLDSEVIALAKEFAKSHHRSLSRMVEDFFRSLHDLEESSEPEVTGLVAELSGILPENVSGDVKEAYIQHLEEKYK